MRYAASKAPNTALVSMRFSVALANDNEHTLP